MKNVYQTIWLELPYEIVQITDVKMREEMNSHSYLRIKAVISDETQEDVINLLIEDAQVKAGFLDRVQPFFIGCIEDVSCYYEKGQLMILLTAASKTQKWDVIRKKRSFQNLDYTYGDIISRVLAAYPGADWLAKVDTNIKIPGLILQYDETDWEFLCRLASHFGTFLMVEPSSEVGRFYFGLPDINNGKCVSGDVYTIAQQMERFQSYTENASEIILQDNLEWEVTSREPYCLGEQVTWNQVPCQITQITMETVGTEIWYTCNLRRSEGVKSFFYGNRKISGLSLPAIIKERNGNCLRVHFSIDPTYQPGNLVYYTYAIETTSWYCMPEEGSLVHIYFQNWDETSGIAVHAMRMEGGANSVSAKGAVGDKSFSTVDGKAMQFTDSGITFVSDEGQASKFTLAKDGSLNMNAANISLGVGLKLSIGEGNVLAGEGETEVIAKELSIETKGQFLLVGLLNTSGEEVAFFEDRGIALSQGDVMLAAPTVLSYEAEQKNPPGIQYSDEALKAEDKAQRDAHNAEVFEVKEKESSGKINVGAALWIGGAIIGAIGITALTGGFAAPAAFAAVGGTVASFCGAARVVEGAQDLNKMSSGDFSKSDNWIRDGICGGNQETYDMVMYGSIMLGASGLLAMFAGPALKAASHLARCGVQMGMAAGMSTTTMLMQDLTDGYIDSSFGEYCSAGIMAAATAGAGYAMGLGFVAAGKMLGLQSVVNAAGKFAPALIIGGETGIDVFTDWALSNITGQKFVWQQSLIMALSTNLVASIDPVNMATGAFFLTATDLVLPDLIENGFKLQRIYNSVLPCHGGLGKNWMLGLESRLFFREEEGLISAMCMDGHMERFRREEDEWINQREGDARYQLKKVEKDGYALIYIPEQKWYAYDDMGRLVAIHGKGDADLKIQYEESRIDKVITSTGYELNFQYENNRIVEIRDELGRTIRYRYEDDCLKAVCHVDEGVTTYHYDNAYNITQVIDQNGHAYVTNEYDNKGRVIVQHYLDGTKSSISYDTEKRENTVYIEALGRTERYRYNKDFLVTHTFYDDGTVEEVGYDQWTNHVYEKDRNGNVTKRNYSVTGLLLEEELPSGQKWIYEYDEKGNQLSKKANTGETLWYRYNDSGFLIEEAIKLKDTVWKKTSYNRDRYGRIISQTDSLGNTTKFEYQDKHGHIQLEPSQVIDALNQHTYYEYDLAGRRTKITTDYGTAEFCYNSQNYPCYIQDGNGNGLRRVYDKMGNLTALFPPNQGADGKAWMYRYDFFDRLVETRDPLGHIWKKERNLAGNILCEISPEGYETRYDYNTDGLKIRTIYPDGSAERCFYDGNGNLIKKIRPEYYDLERDDGPGLIYEYDSMNRLIKMIGEDGRIRNTFCYDSSGNLIKQTDGAGNETFHIYDYAGNRTATWKPLETDGRENWYSVTVYEYDSEANKILEKRGLDKVRAGEYARHYHELMFTYDALNRLTSVNDQGGAKAIYSYDCLNHKTSERFRISPEVERIIRYKYDAAGNLIEKSEGIEERFLKPGGKRSTVWAATRYEYDKNGNCIRSISPKGYEREKYYDAVDRVIQEEERDKESGIHRIYRYEYDGNGNLMERLDESIQGVKKARRFRYDSKERLTHLTDEAGATTRLFYDRNDRIVKVVRPEQYDSVEDDGNGIQYCYDSDDHVVEITGPDHSVLKTFTYDHAGNLKAMLEGNRIYTEYDYDLAGNSVAVYTGREKAEKKKAAQRFTYDAQGNITGIEDGNQNHTGFVLDTWGRIIEVHTPEGGVERYTYDYAGNITSTTDANGGTIVYRYNSLGQVCEITDQEGNTEYFYYDEEGRQETHVDRNGNVERTLYNMDNRLTYQRAEDKKGRNPVVNQYVYYPDGTLKEAASGGITYCYEYTQNGLLKRKASLGKTLLQYSYDKNRNVTSMVDVTGKQVRYAYDAMNRLKRVEDVERGVALAGYRYTTFGRIETLEYGNGIKSEYQYGEDGNLSSLVTVTPKGEVLLNYEYAYDGNGNCTKKSGERYRNEYVYDRMNRLTEAAYDGSREYYTYDLAGNRLKKETGKEKESYIYNARNQLLRLEKGAEVTDYYYDAQGNLLEESGNGRKKYTFDALNRLSSVATDSIAQKNHYDGESLRYEVEENDKVIRFVFDRGELSAEENAGQKIRYIHGNDNVVCSERKGEDAEYHICDEAGSTLFILDREKNIRKTYRYDAFGKLLEERGDIENHLTYTGQMYDGATGQYYLRARFYNPVIGRFLQEDVYRGDGLNLYAYCANNPVMYYDPSGLKLTLCVNTKVEPSNKIKNSDIVGEIDYNHYKKQGKVTDIDELTAQVQGQIDGINKILEMEGMAGLKKRIEAYNPVIEQEGRQYVKTLEPAPEGMSWLHVPDMRIGGGPKDVNGYGVSRNNSVIGGQQNRVASEILNMPDNITKIIGFLKIFE